MKLLEISKVLGVPAPTIRYHIKTHKIVPTKGKQYHMKVDEKHLQFLKDYFVNDPKTHITFNQLGKQLGGDSKIVAASCKRLGIETKMVLRARSVHRSKIARIKADIKNHCKPRMTKPSQRFPRASKPNNPDDLALERFQFRSALIKGNHLIPNYFEDAGQKRIVNRMKKRKLGFVTSSVKLQGRECKSLELTDAGIREINLYRAALK